MAHPLQTRPTKILLGLILLLVLGLPQTGQATQSIGIKLDSYSYFVNLEYSGEATKYREGQTFFGQHLILGLVYRPHETVKFTAGGFFGRTFGHDDELEEIQPYLQFAWKPNEHFELTFGNLNRDRHTFLDAIFDDTLHLERRPTETGFELFGAYKWLTQSAWINWQAINTEAHREKFDVGAITNVDLNYVILDFQFHWSHRGGQLFDNGPLTNDLTTALGAKVLLPIPGLDEAGVSGHWLHSYWKPDSLIDESFSGDGAEFGAWLTYKGYKLWVTYWTGDNFWTEDGDPFYQADNHFKFGLKKTWEITDWISVGAAVDGLVVDGGTFFNEYLFISLRANFDKPITWENKKW